jgi:hypothetical protein
MQSPQTSGRVVSASSPEGRSILAQTLETGEPAWMLPWYEHLYRKGLIKSVPKMLDVDAYIKSLGDITTARHH